MKVDGISKLKIPGQIKMKKSSQRTDIVMLPRVTDGGQTLEWVASGTCSVQKFTGSSDLGGLLWASGAGNCVVSVNTPWGSNLFQPVNKAVAIEVFPETALTCRGKASKVVKFVGQAPCPKGFKKSS